MRDELEAPATLLVGKQPATFAEADRLRGEAELRLSVVPPLLGLLGVLVAVGSPFWLLALPGIGVLLWQGIRREDATRLLVAQAIRHDRDTPSPVRDDFASYVDSLRDRYAEEDNIDTRLADVLTP